MSEPFDRATNIDVPTHPEEMKGSFDFRVGKSISLQARGRITPAGLVSAGVTVALIALAVRLLSTPGRRW